MRYWYPPEGFGGSGDFVPTADYTPAKVLEKLLTVDGAGSLLDADLLDGNEAAAFALSGHNHAGIYATAAHGHANLDDYVIGCQLIGQPEDEQILMIHSLPMAIDLDLRDPGHHATCKTRPTADATFTLKAIRASDSDSVTIGTITFSAASNSGTFAGSASHAIAAERYLQLEAPATADATLADTSFTFLALKA